MISHKHQCIFIHISKCAGTSIEGAFGIDSKELNYEHLYGWCPENRLYLQHATPQQLLDFGYIDQKTWNEYYKFVIIRNPWSRAYSDYLWSINNENIYDGFSNFLIGGGKFKESFSRDRDYNLSDHLTKQKEYFFYNGSEIEYDKVIKFEELGNELKKLASTIRSSSIKFQRKKKYKSKETRALFFILHK